MCTGAEAMIFSAASSGAQLGLGLSATENEAKMAELRRQNLTDSSISNGHSGRGYGS